MDQKPADQWGEAGKLMQSTEARRSRSPPPRRRCVVAKVTIIVALLPTLPGVYIPT